MELKRALELRTEYAGSAGVIRVDSQDYVCLNEMAAFFPNKRLDHWLANDTTKDFISLIEKTIIPGKSGIIKNLNTTIWWYLISSISSELKIF